MTTDPKQTDISSLRIDRTKKPPSESRLPRWPFMLAGAAALVIGIWFISLRAGMDKGREVDLTSAVLTYPSQANAVLSASGYVVAQVKAAVASKGTGRLVYLGFEEGDRVKKGEIIARLEDEDVRAALEKSQADVQLARADSEDAHQTLLRQQKLYASGLSSRAELDAAQARFSRVRAQIRSSDAAVRAAEVGVENTRIRAPFDGTILTKNADVGEVFAPFASSANSRGAVVTMADMSSLQVEADVSESNIVRVRAGQPCEITLDAYPEKRYAGKVHKIVPTADRAKATVLTKIAFSEIDGQVLPEMSAKVTFLSKESDMAAAGAPPKLTVPSSSVVSRGGAQVVLLARDGIIQEVPVATGGVIGDRVEIKEGIRPGDQVVLTPDAGLTSGTRIQSRTKQ